MRLPVICFPWCPPRSLGCQQAFGLTDLQFDPGQLYFLLVYSTPSRGTDFNQIVASLENKLFINGTLSCFLFLDSGLFQIILAVSPY